MKNTLALFIILSAFMFFVAGCGKSGKEVKVGDKQNSSETKTGKPLTVSVSESKIEWTGKKVTGQHTGTINISKGEVFEDNGKLTGGMIEIDMTSIKNVDLTDAESNAKLINHLKSDDFFAVGKYPTAKFEITKIEEINDINKPNSNAVITGNLTIKDVTKSITFPAEIKIDNKILKAKADIDVDRTDFNIKYGSGKFFENLGDKVISDKFNLSFNITAK
ncbi:MAG: YceI family protein [Ignavibacteria bacterium]|nr:YceI family protein [Ignavibacteria bacterium]